MIDLSLKKFLTLIIKLQFKASAICSTRTGSARSTSMIVNSLMRYIHLLCIFFTHIFQLIFRCTQDAGVLFDFVTRDKGLKRLALADNNITSIGTLDLSAANNLTDLDLEGTNINNDVIKQLSKGLRLNRYTNSLYIYK